MDIIFATKNKNKLSEIRQIINEPCLSHNILSLQDIGLDIDVVEDCDTFAGNASKKALEICLATGKPTLSDDSGLEIDFLNGAPGVYSARFLGENTDYNVKNNHILSLMKDVPFEKRTARFVCVIAAALPSKTGQPVVICEEGIVEGYIHTEIAGSNGFGYDPLFYIPEYGMTTAEMPEEQKNRISHRGIALRKMKSRLSDMEGLDWTSNLF